MSFKPYHEMGGAIPFRVKCDNLGYSYIIYIIMSTVMIML